jgi:hypothetical protein
MAPIWDNGMSLDYGRPRDLRQQFHFASFNVPYDFIKVCELTKECTGRVHRLLTNIRAGRLHEEIYAATQAYYPSEELTCNAV